VFGGVAWGVGFGHALVLLLVWFDGDRGCLGVPLVVGGFVRVPMHDPPLPPLCWV